MLRTIRTARSPKHPTLTLGLLGAMGGLTALLAGLTLAPEPANSSPAVPAVVNKVQVTAQTTSVATSIGEIRRAVRVVYPGPITR